MRSLLVLFCIFGLALCAKVLPPLIITPGWMGSTLHVEVDTATPILKGCPKKASFDIWNTGDINETCMLAWMKYDVSIVNGAIVEKTQPGVKMGPTVFNSTEGCGGCYPEMIGNFTAAGWVQGRNLFMAHYNWIASPSAGTWYSDLKKLVENAYALNRNTKVVLVAHSSGPLMQYYFLNKMTQAWKTKYVAAIVGLSGDFAGQAGFIEPAIDGWTPGFSTPNKIARATSETWLNVPAQFAVPCEYKNTVIVQTPAKNYTTQDYNTMINEASLTLLQKVWPIMEKQLPFPNHPGVDVLCMWGSGYPTPIGPIYNSTIKNVVKGGYGTADNSIMVPGDDNQEWITNTACKIWARESQFRFDSKEWPGVHHEEMTTDQKVLNKVIKFAKEYSQTVNMGRSKA